MTREGVDYSSGGFPGGALLAASGKTLAGLYAVDDPSPNGRGSTPEEVQDLVANGVSPFWYWESSEGWMLGGSGAGANAAQNAAWNIAEDGGGDAAASYFACDFDASDEQMPAIADCLTGAASVIGWGRTAFYGGYGPIDWLVRNGIPVAYYCQTLAWEYGRGLHPKANLYQYGFNAWFGGVNCDLVRAYTEDFGQFPRPIVAKPKLYATSELPAWWNKQLASPTPSDQSADGVHWMAVRRNVVAVHGTGRYSRPDPKSPASGPSIKTRDKVLIERVGTVRNADGHPQDWFIDHDGNYLFAGRFSPRIQIKHRQEEP